MTGFETLTAIALGLGTEDRRRDFQLRLQKLQEPQSVQDQDAHLRPSQNDPLANESSITEKSAG